MAPSPPTQPHPQALFAPAARNRSLNMLLPLAGCPASCLFMGPFLFILKDRAEIFISLKACPILLGEKVIPRYPSHVLMSPTAWCSLLYHSIDHTSGSQSVGHYVSPLQMVSNFDLIQLCISSRAWVGPGNSRHSANDVSSNEQEEESGGSVGGGQCGELRATRCPWTGWRRSPAS